MSASLPRVLVIDDNPDFGGHQVMTAYGLAGLVNSGICEVIAMHHPDNHKNLEKWGELVDVDDPAGLRIEVAPTSTGKFQAVRRFFQFNQIAELRERIEAIRPSLVLVIQGNIEQGCSVFRLAGKIPCPVVSYIPVPHRHAEMGAKLGALRDLTCRGLYAEADGFITISETLGTMLRDNGAIGRVQIVENGIPLERFKALPSKEEARKQLGLPLEGFLWGQVGRTEFKQKGQDFALELFLERRDSYADEQLAFLGSGPDLEALGSMAGSVSEVHCLPWTDDPSPFYAAMDALILPSRYEGVPLAMLEALANGLPVASTDRDGMVDWLPSEWRFEYREKMSGMKALEAVRNADPDIVNSLKVKVWKDHSLGAFQRAFVGSIAKWL